METNMETTITLTTEEKAMLDIFLQCTKGFRKEEIAVRKMFAKMINEDGSPKFKNARTNLEFWLRLDETIQEIERKLTE